MTILKNIFHYRYSIFIILLTTLVSCATDDLSQLYQGDKKPDSEVAKILLPSGLKVAQIDDKAIKTPFNPDGFQPMGLLPGKHLIRVFYKEYWGAETNGSVVVSDIFDFNVNLEAGKEYVFQHNGPTDLIDADIENFVSDIKIWFYQPDTKTKIQASGRSAYGNIISHSIRTIATTTPAAEQSTPQTELEQLQSSWKMADDRQRNKFKTWVANRSLNAKPTTDSASSNAAKTPDSEKTTEKDTDQQLQHWWKMADDKQRKVFSDWIANRSLDGKGLL